MFSHRDHRNVRSTNSAEDRSSEDPCSSVFNSLVTVPSWKQKPTNSRPSQGGQPLSLWQFHVLYGLCLWAIKDKLPCVTAKYTHKHTDTHTHTHTHKENNMSIITVILYDTTSSATQVRGKSKRDWKGKWIINDTFKYYNSKSMSIPGIINMHSVFHNPAPL